MVEKGSSFIQRQLNEITEGLIAFRQSGEPFFGVQTVFAPLIDRMIERREQKKEKSKPSEKDQPINYHIRPILFQRGE